MTKAKTKGAKIKAKKAAKAAKAALGGVAALYAQFERDAASPPPQPLDDPLAAPTQARRNQMGEKFSDKDLLDSSNETEAGKALAVAVADKDERRDLFELFMAYDKAVSIYCIRVLGRSRFPAVSKLEFMPERLETRADDRPDLRTEEQKIESARRDMAYWDGILVRLHPYRARIIRNAHNERFVSTGALTGAGRSFIAAIRALRDVVCNG